MSGGTILAAEAMRIDLYFMRQILGATLIVVGSLTGVIWLSQSLRFVDLIINRGVPPETLAFLTMLLLPTWLSIVLPVGIFVGTIFVYNRMTGDREIVVLEASGISPLRLARPALTLAAVITLVCYLLTLWVIPLSYRAFKDLQFQIRHNYTELMLREGVFSTITDNVMLFVRTRHAGDVLEGIIIHDERDPDETVTIFAVSGSLEVTSDGPTIGLHTGTRQARDMRTGKVEFLSFDSYEVDFRSEKTATRGQSRDRNELFIVDLLEPKAEQTPLRDFDSLIAEGHYRLTAPLLALVLPLAGLAVLLRGELSRRGAFMRILLAIAVAAAIQVLVLSGKLLAARYTWLIPAMYGTVVVPGLIAVSGLMRQRLARRGPARAPS